MFGEGSHRPWHQRDEPPGFWRTRVPVRVGQPRTLWSAAHTVSHHSHTDATRKKYHTKGETLPLVPTITRKEISQAALVSIKSLPRNHNQFRQFYLLFLELLQKFNHCVAIVGRFLQLPTRLPYAPVTQNDPELPHHLLLRRGHKTGGECARFPEFDRRRQLWE